MKLDHPCFKNTLLLGASGMLGQAIADEAERHSISLLTPSSSQLNLSDESQIIQYIITHKPTLIINCVADINLLSCEKNTNKAHRINALPSKTIVSLQAQNRFKYVYISTDHFYNQDKALKHDENSEVKILNEYAKSKYEGEQFTATDSNSLILRTNIIGFNKNTQKPTFIEWAIKSILKNEPMILFDDFYTSSISTKSFSKYMFQLIALNANGLINLASSSVSSKKELILHLAKLLNMNLPKYTIQSIHTLKGANRGDSLGLNVAKCESILKCKLPKLEDVLQDIIREFKELKYEK
jgi:dTDP-4-dehydrorhamnose reductase